MKEIICKHCNSKIIDKEIICKHCNSKIIDKDFIIEQHYNRERKENNYLHNHCLNDRIRKLNGGAKLLNSPVIPNC